PQSVKARWIEPDDSMTKTLTLKVGDTTTSEPFELDAAATADDGAIVAWHNGKATPFRKIEAAYVTSDSLLSEPVLPTSGAGSIHAQAAPTSSGGSLMAWREGTSIRAQAFSPTGVPGSLQTPAPVLADPFLATDGHDHFQLVYKVGSVSSSLAYQALSADGG